MKEEMMKRTFWTLAMVTATISLGGCKGDGGPSTSSSSHWVGCASDTACDDVPGAVACEDGYCVDGDGKRVEAKNDDLIATNDDPIATTGDSREGDGGTPSEEASDSERGEGGASGRTGETGRAGGSTGGMAAGGGGGTEGNTGGTGAGGIPAEGNGGSSDGGADSGAGGTTGTETGGMGGDGGQGPGGSSTGGLGGHGGQGPGGSSTGGWGGDGAEASTGGSSSGGLGGNSGACESAPSDVATVLGNLDGQLLTYPCGSTEPVDYCVIQGVSINGAPPVPCESDQLDLALDYPVAGPAGVNYEVTLHFYGLLELRDYGSEVVRDAAPASQPSNEYVDADPDEPGFQYGDIEPAPFATALPTVTYPSSDRKTYEVHVFDQNDEEVTQYLLNAASVEANISYIVDFERTISVVGGGRIRIRTFDADCTQVKNCGVTPGYPCANKTREVEIAPADPQPDALIQPGLGLADDHAGQWLLIDVTAVRPMCEP